MQQFKLFKGIESDAGGLETEINNWLRDNSVRVIQSFGNIAPQTPGSTKQESGGRMYAPSDLFVGFLYESND